MEKINFKDGVLVTPSKVLINGEEYEVIPPEYTGKPLTAEQLNKMQDNIEEAIQTESAEVGIIQEDGTPSETNVYSSKAVQNIVNKASFCKMTSNFEEKTITEETKITGFKNAINYGYYTADITNSRLEIKNTTLCQLSGLVCGLGSNRCYYKIFDSEGTELDLDLEIKTLYQFGGNGYWQAPLPTITVELDPTKTYYIYLYCNKYNADSFLLNAGFGSNGTWIGATKIL